MHRIIKTKMDTPLYAESEVGILNPNCSECTFRLSGDFKEIKKQVFNMIEWIEMEYDGRVGDGPQEKLSSEQIKMFKDLRKQVKVTTSLKEIEQIVISFTCNYETFFQEKDGDLLVATCNNYTYDNVDKIETNDEYYEIAGKTSYDIIENYDGSWVLKLKYDDEDHIKFPRFIITEKDIVFNKYDGKKAKVGDDIEIIARNGVAYRILSNRLEPILELQDKAKLNKIKIVLNLESHK